MIEFSPVGDDRVLRVKVSDEVGRRDLISALVTLRELEGQKTPRAVLLDSREARFVDSISLWREVFEATLETLNPSIPMVAVTPERFGPAYLDAAHALQADRDVFVHFVESAAEAESWIAARADADLAEAV